MEINQLYRFIRKINQLYSYFISILCAKPRNGCYYLNFASDSVRNCG